MKTLHALVWKDLRRAWRNPVSWMVFLAIPLVITALIGLVFGPKSNNTAIGRIRFALVDEDDSQLTRILKGALNQGGAGTNLEAILLSRLEAMQQVQDNKLSAMLVIPQGFTRAYLISTNVVSLELVKNPAESIHPAVLEELLGVLATALDALKRKFGPELPQLQALFEGQGDYHQAADLVVRIGDRVEAARKIIFPPRVTYTKGENSSEAPVKSSSSSTDQEYKGDSGPPNQTVSPKKSSAPQFNIFGYLLPGLAAMFLLFLGENASRDIQVELQQRTLQRFSTLHEGVVLFVGSKILFCLVFLLLSSAVMLGGGGLIFDIHWGAPWVLFALTFSYCLFASGLMTLLPALLGEHQSSQAFSNIAAMFLGLAGGSTFPAEHLPPLLRDHVTPLMPTYWYITAVRHTFENNAGWLFPALELAVSGTFLIALAVSVLRRRLERGR